MDFRAIPLENAVGLNREEKIKIPCRSPVHARLAFPAEPNAGAVLYTLRNVNRKGLFFGHPAVTAAILAGFVNLVAAATAGNTGTFHGEEALLSAHLAMAMAGRTSHRLRPTFTAAAVASVTGHGCGHTDGGLFAFEGLNKRNFHVVAQVAAPRRCSALPPATPCKIAEHFIENVGKAAREIEPSGMRTGTAGTASLKGGVAETIVGRTFVLITKNLVSLANVFKLLFGVFVARILVGVVFHSQLTVRLLDVACTCVSANAEYVIIILFGHDLTGVTACLLKFRRNPQKPEAAAKYFP
jgi:hypothetical protein